MIMKETEISGCMVIEPFIAGDNRGGFIKTFNTDIFSRLGISVEWREQYYTISKKNVIRGMHFQMPPYDHEKLVTLISGEVLDVILDLRSQSISYRKVIAVKLTADNPMMIYMPRGVAHGFLGLTEDSLHRGGRA